MIEVEIWSDLVCPFCYIGKRNWEAALLQFAHRDQVKVIWRSFELDPNAKKEQGIDIYDLLAKKYGRDRKWAIDMNKNVVRTAASVGLKFDMDRVIPTSSFDAHRLAHLAANHGLQDQAEERLFSAYFVEGKHLANHETLKVLASKIGLNSEVVEKMLRGTEYSKEVRQDEKKADSFKVNGVPFYLFNQKLAVSGAQPPELFLKALNQVWNEK